MRPSDYHYHLPKERIAQRPASKRDHSRLLVLDRAKKQLQHRRFDDLPGYFREGDVLVVNDSKVFPARLTGRKETGGKLEVFLLTEVHSGTWECLIGGKVRRVGLRLTFGRQLTGEVTKRLPNGTWHVRFDKRGIAFQHIIDRIGDTPTPPYIKRTAKAGEYQTVYARERGSVAAPTAGLHFTPKLLSEIRAKGVQITPVTLHVGWGTFQPLTQEHIQKRKLHPEYATVFAQSLRTIRTAKREERRIIAVGTTSVRVLESIPLNSKRGFSGWIDTFIMPPYRFRVVDGMVTNFHLPESSLLMLVSAFAGKKKTLAAYQRAVQARYRFYSFGDAMFII